MALRISQGRDRLHFSVPLQVRDALRAVTSACVQGERVAIRVSQGRDRLHFAVAGMPLQVPDAFLEPPASCEAPLPLQVPFAC